MGIKKTLASLATSKLLDNIKAENIDNTINSLLNKASKLTGGKTTEEHISSIKECNYLIIKSKSYSIGTIAGALIGQVSEKSMSDYLGRYRVIDQWGNLRYKSDAENTVSDRDIVNIFDVNKKQIGRIKEHLFSAGFPGLAKEAKTCSVWYNKEKIARLKKYKCVDKIRYTVLEGDVEITHEETKNITIKYRNTIVARLHRVPINLKDGYADKYVMEIPTPENEAVGVLFAIAVDIISA